MSQNEGSENPIDLPFRAICLLITIFISGSIWARPARPATAPPDKFRWIHANSDPQIWQQILDKFNEELTPDQASPDKSGFDTYRYKWLQKVGLFNHSALVIVGHRPSNEITKENEWNVVYSAFNFDVVTGEKSPIEHAEWLWQWKLVRLARFGPAPAPDVTFTYLSCTECEPDSMFSSFYYDTAKSEWQMRPWGDGKDLWWTASDGLVVELDIIGDGPLTFFDCVYGILGSQDTTYQKLAMRCKEFTETDSGESKAADNTVLYSLSGGEFKARRVADSSEVISLTQQICRPAAKNILCRLPTNMSLTAGQHEVLTALFPNAATTACDMTSFQALKRTMKIAEIVTKCGLPDELGGSGIYVFTYHLTDGTYVNISSAGTDTPILYANHLDANGHGTDLVPVK